jgi:hemerythrin-like domain-containing protein
LVAFPPLLDVVPLEEVVMVSQADREADVINMLKKDHREMERLFHAFETATGGERAAIANTAIRELERHADLEETLIYPIFQKALEDKDIINKGLEAHHLVHVLLAEIKKLKPAQEKFRAKFTVLAELVKHHIQEEETVLFTQADNREINWTVLETKMRTRKQELLEKTSEPAIRSSRLKNHS